MPVPPASFEILVLSMRAQAEMLLGLFPSPDGTDQTNLPMARHTIDLLAVLQDKTKGNLTMEQQRLLENSVTELRFRYVQALQQDQSKTAPSETATVEAGEPQSNG